MATYKGFSTKNFVNGGKTLRVYDVACVKDDLYRHIFTIYGERVYMPGFGTDIPTTAFEPNDPTTVEMIRSDLTDVINNDPRVQLQNMQLFSTPNEYSIVAIVDLYYVEFNMVDQMRVELKS